jgi:hypothetical protein
MPGRKAPEGKESKIITTCCGLQARRSQTRQNRERVGQIIA